MQVKKIFIFCALALFAFSKAACAFSSIAVVDGYAKPTFSAAGNYESQEKADRSALEGCRTNAKKSKLAKLAGKCEIVMRGKGGGYGAVDCATNGCNWVTGYESKQGAVDAAYNDCSANYQDCQQTHIGAWADFAGFPRESVEQPQMQTAPSMSDVYRARWAEKQNPPARISMEQLNQMALECRQAQKDGRQCQSEQEFLQTHPPAQ